MDENRRRIVAWVGSEILPHEADVRAWLRRSLGPAGDVEDVIQEAYCRLVGLKDVDHILSSRAYFFTVARGIVIDEIRRSRVVRIDTVTEIDALHVVLDDPSPERIAAGRRELARVQRLIAALPERCRRIFEMRKIDGLPQREIARRMGVPETTVENDIKRGLRLLLKALADGERASQQASGIAESHGRTRDSRRD